MIKQKVNAYFTRRAWRSLENGFINEHITLENGSATTNPFLTHFDENKLKQKKNVLRARVAQNDYYYVNDGD